MSELFCVFNGENGYQVIIEENEKVCYAYLFNHASGFHSDVWLYNVTENPTFQEWLEPNTTPPFRNPKSYISDAYSRRSASCEEIAVDWILSEGEVGNLSVIVRINDVPVALLKKGEKPGFHYFVINDSPVAKAMTAGG